MRSYILLQLIVINKKKTFNFVPLGNGVKDFGDVMSEPFSDCLIIERLSFVHIFGA